MNSKWFLLCFFISCFSILAQTNKIHIKAVLDDEKEQLNIQQKIVFYNKTDSVFSKIYLHNWANSFKNRNTPLGKRFIEDYSKDFYFSKKEDKGFTTIFNLQVANKEVFYQELINKDDVLELVLHTPLKPKDSTVITANYTVKIPNARFTGFGKTNTGYHLRFWYLTPAVYQKGWQIMSNLNLDDLYMDVADYVVEIKADTNYKINANLYPYITKKRTINNFI